MPERVPVTDPALLQQLNAAPAAARTPVTDPGLLQQLNSDEFKAAGPQAQYGGGAQPPADLADQLADQGGPNYAADAAASAVSGLGRGIVETAMTPITLKRLGEQGVDWALRHTENAGRWALGYPQVSAEDFAKRGADAPKYDKPVYDAQDAVRGFLDRYLYEPKTTAGEYARTIGEFVPSAVVGPGGFVRKAVGDVLVPAVASETAGQAFKGSDNEWWARFIGGLAGNVGVAAKRARADAPARMVRAATEGMTSAEFAASRDLQQRAAAIGVPLAGPEAIQAATGGATKLGDVQRAVEGAGGPTLTRFYADRPDQVAAAAGRLFDRISPQDPRPSTLGPRAAAVANDELDAVRQGINDTTRGDYQIAESNLMAPQDYARFDADPAYQASLRRLRQDEVLGPKYKDMPDNAIAVIDATVKDMQSRGEALSNRANPGFQPQVASMYGQAGQDIRSTARQADPTYDYALAEQERLRRTQLEPLEQGPLGRLAGAGDTRAAGEAILPAKPLTGSDDEFRDLLQRLVGRDPATTSALVRQRLADQFDQSAGRLVGGQNQYGGARFARDIAGSSQQERNILEVLGILPNGQAIQSAARDMIDVGRATGARKPQGSPTAFNELLKDEMGALPLGASALAGVKTAGLAAARQVGDSARRAWLGRNSNTLADLFTAPDSVAQIEAIFGRAAESPFADAVMRQALQAQAMGQ